jgi:DNA helicase-2/ATP-dependent DNA helicase PcrA
VISPQDIEDVTGQITSVYAKIMNHEFSEGCGKKECDWCHFVKSNFKQPGNILETVEGEETE